MWTVISTVRADLALGAYRYEGEFTAGFASGMGQYTGANGEVYRGEWMYGKRHGCASTGRRATMGRACGADSLGKHSLDSAVRAYHPHGDGCGAWSLNPLLS